MNKLAKTIARGDKPRHPPVVVKQAKIIVAYNGFHQAAIEIDGETEPNVPALDHVQLVAGLGCWVMMLGRGRWIIIGTIAPSGSFPGGLVPAGSSMDYFGTAAPDGWLTMVGQTVVNAQTLYPAAWAVLPTSWRSGANLILPDTRGKFFVNQNTGDASFDVIGETGGSKTTTLVEANLPSHTHAVGTLATGNQSQDHTHTITTGTVSADHTHSGAGGAIIQQFGGGDAYLLAGAQGHAVYGPYNTAGLTGISANHTHSGTTSGMNVSHTHAITGATAATGSGTAINILPPYIVTLKIIKMH